MENLEKININQIDISNHYLRMKTDVDSLVKSISNIGLINPLTINKEKKLLAGARRYCALKLLGIEEVNVIIVERTLLEQELISIDENLIRKPLEKIEFESCLNRGRDIYEQLNPSAKKVNFKLNSLSPSQKKEQKEIEENDKDSFIAVTSQKTGISKAVLKNALQRDQLSSKKLKDARQNGQFSATETNQLIRLKQDQQDQIVDLVGKISPQEVKEIVKNIKKIGIDQAIKQADQKPTIDLDLLELEKQALKFNKLLKKINQKEITLNNQPDTHKEKISKLLNMIKEEINIVTDQSFMLKRNNSDLENQNSIQ